MMQYSHRIFLFDLIKEVLSIIGSRGSSWLHPNAGTIGLQHHVEPRAIGAGGLRISAYQQKTLPMRLRFDKIFSLRQTLRKESFARKRKIKTINISAAVDLALVRRS
jgi:hypothetical protein